MIYYGNELYHSGVKGQKWGVRNYQNTDGTWTSLGKKRRREENLSDDYKNARDGKTYKELNTNELQARNNRYNQERLYRQNQQNELKEKKESTKFGKIKKQGRRIVNGIIAAGVTIGGIATAMSNFDKLSNAVSKIARNMKPQKAFTVIKGGKG